MWSTQWLRMWRYSRQIVRWSLNNDCVCYDRIIGRGLGCRRPSSLQDLGDTKFANFPEDQSKFETAHENECEPLELGLVRAIWDWCAVSAADGDALAAATTIVGREIDVFLSRVFRMSKLPEAQAWWLDGMMSLSLTKHSLTRINAVGATIWAGKGPGFYLAPFECDFFFAAPKASECDRIIVRFGKLNHQGEIAKLRHDKLPAKVVELRPSRDADWAFAVEIS